MNYWLINDSNDPTKNAYCKKLNPTENGKIYKEMEKLLHFGPTNNPDEKSIKLANKWTPTESTDVFKWYAMKKFKVLKGLIDVVGQKMNSGWPAKCNRAIQQKRENKNKK
jgi:hypothetical protein